MPLPQWLARFNRVGTNRVTGLVAGRLPGWGFVIHEGRKSGRTYRTPVNVFRRDGGLSGRGAGSMRRSFVVALTYGSDSQWLKNVLAAGRAEILTRSSTHPVVNPRVVTDARRTPVPRPVRPILRLVGVDEFLLVDRDAGDRDSGDRDPDIGD